MNPSSRPLWAAPRIHTPPASGKPAVRLGPAAAVLLLVACWAGGPARAELDGRAVMEEVDRRSRSEGMYSEGLLTVERRGRVRRKAWRNMRSGWGEDHRSLLQFIEPPEVKGVSLLTLRRRDSADEQWLYAPEIDRVRRIAAREKSTRFLGTDFTYEDMQERDLEEFTYRLLDERELDGVPCYLVEGRPLSHRSSHYSKLIFWVRTGEFVVVRVEGYIEGELRRAFNASELRPVDGILTAHRWEVVDLKRDSRTVLALEGVRYNLPYAPGLFTRQGMRVLHSPPPEGR